MTAPFDCRLPGNLPVSQWASPTLTTRLGDDILYGDVPEFAAQDDGDDVPMVVITVKQ